MKKLIPALLVAGAFSVFATADADAGKESFKPAAKAERGAARKYGSPAQRSRRFLETQFVNELGQPVTPSVVRVVPINRRSGTIYLWKDPSGRTVNDPALPPASAQLVGITATWQPVPGRGGAWILGGQTPEGSRPRGQ